MCLPSLAVCGPAKVGKYLKTQVLIVCSYFCHFQMTDTYVPEIQNNPASPYPNSPSTTLAPNVHGSSITYPLSILYITAQPLILR